MAIYENENSPKAYLATQMLEVLPGTFGGTFADYKVWYAKPDNANYLYIETNLATQEQLTDFVDNFQGVDTELIQVQLNNAKRGLFIKRKFATILDKREIKLWL